MTSGRPFEQLVEDWLADGAPASFPASLHAAVVQRARHTGQRRPALGRPWPRIIGRVRLAVDLAAVVVLAIAAANLLAPRSPATWSGASPSATSAPTETPGPTPSAVLEVHPFGADYHLGRHALTVDGITFSFSIDAPGWEPYEGFLISRWIIGGPQSQEGVVFWAAFPAGEKAESCLQLRSGSGSSARDVAVAVATAPGTELLSGPIDDTVGGHHAVYTSVVVREVGGCDPGFVYSWRPQSGGAEWTQTVRGDKVQAWVVEVDGRLLFIGALTRGTYLVPQIDAIVASMRFE